MDEDFGQLEPLGQGERPLEGCGGGLVVAGESAHAAELGERRRKLAAGLALLELRDRLLEPRRRFLQPALPDIDVGERGAGTRGGPGVARLGVEAERALALLACFDQFIRLQGEPARLLEQFGLEEAVLGKRRCLMVVASALFGGAERPRPLARTRQHLARFRPDSLRVVCLGRGLEGGQVVGSEHLGHLVELGEGALEVLGGSQVAGLALPLRECLVGNMTDEVLQEPVLTALGRARIRLHAQHLLAHQPGQQRLELLYGCAGEGRERLPGEGLPEHRPVLEQAPLLLGEPVEAGCDQGMEGFRHLERLDLSRRRVDGPVLIEQAAVEQHPHRLHRIQRHPFSARQDLLAQTRRQAGHQPLQQLLHRALRERLQEERGEIPLAGAPARAALLQLRTGQGDHIDRVLARPLQQVLDEVEQARVRPLHVLEGEHCRVRLRQPLEEQPPGREQILPVARGCLVQTE